MLTITPWKFARNFVLGMTVAIAVATTVGVVRGHAPPRVDLSCPLGFTAADAPIVAR